ncbi:SGNH/GDSL hydrolase family protein [Flavobacterium sp. 7A]|uniref:SGNH/GDSL hydrolase family protein n=1 Tax=Flavobacterium sp. 7A TaxID=2940571 RepID=UPI0022265F02|nr:SGNH/GDSL hydrolase family protein [Flavobacterium sp. 7A]MCW2118168.1 lysophospholipase L1-like esterase [Flavobacterium sp. 7A]
MKKTIIIVVTVVLTFLLSNCTAENPATKITTTPSDTKEETFKYLALGDSYTIGQSVCSICSFPEQLKNQLTNTTKNHKYTLEVIARTGWTTTHLIDAIKDKNPSTNYNLVSLLIGVNNQFQDIDFSVYEKELPQLINQSIAFANGNKKRVIVVSIPDYAFTPFGQNYRNPTNTSLEIDHYNAFAKKYCEDNSIQFLNITDITRDGIKNPSLVTNDGLHPSAAAYTLFVERLLPLAFKTLQEEKQ